MRCALRREEIRAILSNHFRTEVEDFVIIPSRPSHLGTLIRAALTEPENKETYISNIKALRILATSLQKYLTLMEAKWAIQNWSCFIDFIDEYNRWPLNGYGSGPDVGILK